MFRRNAKDQSLCGGGHKAYREGTHRTEHPAATFARVRPHMSAMGITRIANLTGLDKLGIPVVGVFRPNSRSVSVAQGKGLHLDAAKASGLMEAVETFHAETVAVAATASAEEISREGAVIDLARLPRTSDVALRPDQPIPWVRAEDWTTGEPIFVPHELVSTDYTVPLLPGTGYFQANTNGLASGNNVLEAVLHGLCELVERDATALWWQRSVQFRIARAIDLDTVDAAGGRWVLDRFAEAGIKVAVWDTTSDIGVASFLCVVYDQGDPPLPELGAGCHPCRDIALLRALTEAAQARTTVISGSRDDLPRRYYTSAVAAARLRQLRSLMKHDAGGVKFAEVPTFDSDSILEDMEHVSARLAAAGLHQIAVADLTREDFGIPVVRVVVPGLEGLLEDDYVPGARALAATRAGA
jgi:ribosomal protein S12 methylthiotransferase accessory factor